MEDQRPDANGINHGLERMEPVRSRWSSKPKQILILESIFNSGMVNPPKDETVRIRKLLEKFGSVGDANVFYWFQNRRSRSRRKQRQIQASLSGGVHIGSFNSSGSIQYEPTASSPSSSNSSSSGGGGGYYASPCLVSSSSCGVGGFCDDGRNDLSSIQRQMGFSGMEQVNSVCSNLYQSYIENLQYRTGFVNVFINGIPSEVPSGQLDMKSMFGEDAVLVNSFGDPVPVNEYGISLQSLQLGENYYLVSRPN